jgi:class 3 adenylate cyclase
MNFAYQDGARLQAAESFARHLQNNPDAANRSVHELASEFQLDESFVNDVIREVREGARTREGEGRFRFSLDPVAVAIGRLRSLFEVLTAEPLPFIAVTAALSISFFIAISGFRIEVVEGIRYYAFQPSRPALIYLGLSTLVMHLACYYMHAQARFAVLGGIICWLITSTTLMVITWFTLRPPIPAEPIPLLLVQAAIMMMVCGLYAGLGAMASVVGGYVRMRREDKILDRMSRQELLARLFEIRERLKDPNVEPPQERRLLDQETVDRFMRHPWFYTILSSFSLALLNYVAISMLGATEGALRVQSPFGLVLQTFSGIVMIVVMVTIAYLVNNFFKALVLTITYTVVSYLTLFLPVSPYGQQALETGLEPLSVVGNVLVAVIIAAGATLGAKVEERAMRERRLRANDPATLLAEMVRIEWRLGEGSTYVCVVVVDAAKSSEMKAAATDPLVAEYSFREYQRLLSDICVANGGRVHNTAGDSAVLAFESCWQALRGAREIQTQIHRFNIETNRLSLPFRLRIGLHAGPVAGDLSKVEFAEVIDVAAHAQSAAPVGGILVTDTVAQSLPNDNLVPLHETVDGHPVYLVYNPTVED